MGGCINDGRTSSADDDLVSYFQYLELVGMDRLCPLFGCDGDHCLGNNSSETLAEHGGVAQGAKLAIFDIFYGEDDFGDFAGNGLWEVCLDAGCKVHSNSWGGDSLCSLGPSDLLYDSFMYNVSCCFRACFLC